MDKKEILDLITIIGTIEDETERRTQLTNLSDNIEKAFNNFDDISTKNKELNDSITKYTEDNEKLREANMQLFLRIGEKKNPTEVIENRTGANLDQEKEPRKFEDLFDDKGGIK